MYMLWHLTLLTLYATRLSSAQSPAEVYDGGIPGNATVKLNIGNGGAGQSGLVKALADAFIEDSVSNGSSAFSVAWYTSDTTYTINYLQSGLLDVGITYSPVAEAIAIDQGIALSPSYYVFRDHFLIVGPQSNPARLNMTDDVRHMFSALYAAAQATNATSPVRFLSRYDKSATNIKESSLWIGIGQVPWATAYSTWYHQFISFPIQALTAAIKLEEYTLTDRGTYLSINGSLAEQSTIYKAATDDEDDPLLNPAHLLIGAKAPNPDMAEAFAEWCVGPHGQDVIANFTKNGQQLYSPAP